MQVIKINKQVKQLFRYINKKLKVKLFKSVLIKAIFFYLAEFSYPFLFQP